MEGVRGMWKPTKARTIHLCGILWGLPWLRLPAVLWTLWGVLGGLGFARDEFLPPDQQSRFWVLAMIPDWVTLPLAWWLVIGLAIFAVAILEGSYRRQRHIIDAHEITSAKLAEYEAKPSLEIGFDPNDLKHHITKAHAVEAAPDGFRHEIQTTYWVKITNVSNKTVKNIQIYGKLSGMNSTKPERMLFFGGDRTITLNPGTYEYAEALAFFGNGIAEGDLAGEWAGPIEIMASGQDITPAKRVFRLNFEKHPVIFD